jgi:hypothetical protein
MDGGRLARLRWRRRGAWMWPAFVGLTVLDAVIGSSLPPTGDGWNAVGAGVFAAVANLIGIVLLSVPLRIGLRRRRPDLPKVVAGDYAGTTTMAAISALLLALGALHHSSVEHDRARTSDAIKRAQAYIGARAPARFRRNVQYVSTFTIQAGSIYRVCVPSADGRQSYCVIVRDDLPFARSVRPDGGEPNSLFGQGVG